MTIADLQALLPDQDAFKRAFRRDETLALLKGNFKIGRTPYINQVVFPDGSQLRLKFYDTVKQILNTKGQPVYGKESFLSYLEVTVAPAGQKAYCYSVDVNQIVWGTSKTKARAKHLECITALSEIATAVGIDLAPATAWSTVYTENY